MSIYLALLLDYLLGDPKWLPHPVVAVGKLIAFYEKLLYPRQYSQSAFRQGCLLVLATLATVAGVLLALLLFLARWPWLRAAVVVYLLYAALAWRSLQVEPGYVISALRSGNLPRARKMLSYVVGRDTENLNRQQIIKATVETIAENTIDGVLAPLFYMALGYLAGGGLGAVLAAWLYKAVNTMDSMVGYKNDRYLHFGRAAAKLDDAANYIPARLAALAWIGGAAIAGQDAKNAWRIWRRDRRNHSSPNSAQTESACAGALGVQLGGPSRYFGKLYEKPAIGDPLRPVEAADIRRAVQTLYGAAALAVLGGAAVSRRR